MHLNLLIHCIVLCQAIVGTISSENIGESSDLLVRHKRVINVEHSGDLPVKAGEFPYVVNIQLRNLPHCVGSILSTATVITSASCASDHVSLYKVVPGSLDIFRGVSYNVINKKVRLGNHPRTRASDGIALLIVDTDFISRRISFARLHEEPILPGLNATVVGWGCLPGLSKTKHPTKLRSITASIMPHRECINAYQGVYDINDEDVCIYHPQKHCGLTDGGAPLIINGELAGVYLNSEQYHRLPPGPEVFVVLQHAHYRQWIKANMNSN